VRTPPIVDRRTQPRGHGNYGNANAKKMEGTIISRRKGSLAAITNGVGGRQKKGFGKDKEEGGRGTVLYRD